MTTGFKRLLWCVLALGYLSTASTLAQDERPPKIGFVNAIRIVEEAPQGKAALQQLEQEFLPREERIRVQVEELQQLEDQLANEGNNMSELNRLKLEQDVRKGRRRLEREQEEFREDLNFRRNQEIENLQLLVHKLIADIGQRDKFDLIVQEPVVWVSNRIDLTEQVLEELREKFSQGQ